MPLTQLPSRYGIARSALYTRLKELKIEQGLDRKRADINAQQLQLLDALHEQIQQGGTTGEFLKQQSGDSPVQSSFSTRFRQSSPARTLESRLSVWSM